MKVYYGLMWLCRTCSYIVVYWWILKVMMWELWPQAILRLLSCQYQYGSYANFWSGSCISANYCMVLTFYVIICLWKMQTAVEFFLNVRNMMVMQILYSALIEVSNKILGLGIWNFDFNHMYKVDIKYFASWHSLF